MALVGPGSRGAAARMQGDTATEDQQQRAVAVRCSCQHHRCAGLTAAAVHVPEQHAGGARAQRREVEPLVLQRLVVGKGPCHVDCAL